MCRPLGQQKMNIRVSAIGDLDTFVRSSIAAIKFCVSLYDSEVHCLNVRGVFKEMCVTIRRSRDPRCIPELTHS